MDNDLLTRRHPLHHKFAAQWHFYAAAYEGVEALLEQNILPRHPRESTENHGHRLRNVIGFGYSASIVDLLTHYLFTKNGERTLDQLGEDPLWRRFEEDADLFGTDLDTYIIEQQKQASIFGHVGILVDMPARAEADNRAMQMEKGVYPYLAAYTPPFILDWRYERDESNRPFLSFLKLQDENGHYRIWTRERWEVWRLDENEPVWVDGGPNPLGQIPFVWLINESSEHRFVGHSDLRHIAAIEASIVRNLSQAEEIVDLAAFPMLRMPVMRGSGPDGGETVVGPRAILEFDPAHGEAGKPDWLASQVREPVAAILDLVALKIAEIYRAANTGGLRATESGGGRSGIALKVEFQRLNARLAAKARNLEEAERGIIRYWLAWRGESRLLERIVITRPKRFEVEELVEELDTLLKARHLVSSRRFDREVAMVAAKKALPGGTPKLFAAIAGELEGEGEKK